MPRNSRNTFWYLHHGDNTCMSPLTAMHASETINTI